MPRERVLEAGGYVDAAVGDRAPPEGHELVPVTVLAGRDRSDDRAEADGFLRGVDVLLDAREQTVERREALVPVDREQRHGLWRRIVDRTEAGGLCGFPRGSCCSWAVRT